MSKSLNLVKGQKADLTKTNPGLTKINIGLGWDVNAGSGSAFDLDAFAILAAGASLEEVLYFNSPKVNGKPSADNGSVVHSGDNLTGAGDGDDETIEVDLSKVSPNIDRILIAVNIYQAQQRGQNFGQVQNAFCRIYDATTGDEKMRHDLSEDYSSFTALVFGVLYRHNGEWKFEVMDKALNGDINQVAEAALA